MRRAAILNRTGEDVAGAVLPLLHDVFDASCATAPENGVYMIRTVPPRNPAVLGAGWSEATGYGWLSNPMLGALVAEGGNTGELDVTGQQVVIRISEVAAGPRVASGAATRSDPTLEAQALETIRATALLPVNRVSDLLGVSRPTLYKWREGTTPRGRAREHLLRTAQLVEDAARRLGDPQAVNGWLMTPITSTGKTPIDLLREHKYDLFRGFLMKNRGGGARPLMRAGVPIQGRDAEDALRRLKPAMAIDDYVDAPLEDE